MSGQPGLEQNQRPVLRLSQLVVIAAAALACAVSAWGISKFMGKAYQASATVMLTEQTDGGTLSALANQISGVTTLLGGGGGGGDKLNEALATLRSHRLALEFMSAGDHLAVLEAAIWHSDRSGLPLEERLDAAAAVLQSEALTVSDDLRAGTIRVSITWFNAVTAARWANEYVSMADSMLRARAIADAQRSIEFLKTAAEEAKSVELRQAVFRIVESRINAEMIATTRPEYAFRVIDPATVPRGHVRPKSWLLAVIGGVLGAAGAFGLIVMGHWRRTSVIGIGSRSAG